MKRLIYVQQNNENIVEIRDVESRKEGPFIYELTITGADGFGSWKGEGAFIMTEFGPFFWMLKFYDDQERARQTGQWSTLIYESVGFGNGWCDGRWFF
jgi:hypothetical protein